MEIIITIKEKKIRLVLMEGKIEKDSLAIVEEHSLSKKLLPSIDKLLKRNDLKNKEVKSARVVSDQDETFTTTRIAQTVAKTWKYTCG